ncbi:MAG: quinol:cytochrome C oxidoreductase [Planctomycetota bacterium]
MAIAAAATLPSSETRRAPASVSGYGSIVLVVGGILLAAAGGIAKASAAEDNNVLDRFWHAYLLGVSYAASLSLGGLFFVIAHHLTGGRWGTSLRRIAEIVASSMPYVALLFIPILANVTIGRDTLYPWNVPAEQLSPLLQLKEPYLNSSFFVARSVAYWVIFCCLTWYFVGGSLKQDKTGHVATLRRLSRASGPSMLVFALTLNFAAFDWMMTLAPTWFSTIFGVYYFAGSFIAFLALLQIIAYALQRMGVLTQSITTDNRHDAAKLMYAFVVFWGYIAFSQFLLIWYANVPEETEWFYIRQQEEPTVYGIPWSLGFLFVTHLFIPFLGFMSSAVRRNQVAMVGWSVYMLLVHALDLTFIVMPGTRGYHGYSTFQLLGPMEIMCLFGGLAVVLGAAMRGAEDKWLLPVRDPRLHQSTTYHNH